MRKKSKKSVPPAAIVNIVQSIQKGIRRFSRHLAPPFVYIMESATGNWQTQLIHIAGVLGIADLLKDGPRSIENLAREQFEALLSGSGFDLIKIHPTAGMFSIIEARPKN